MTYYALPSGREAVVDCERKGGVLSGKRVVVRTEGLKPVVLRSSVDGYPSYEIGNANGIVDVIEHRERNDVFFMADDPDVLVELGVIEP